MKPGSLPRMLHLGLALLLTACAGQPGGQKGASVATPLLPPAESAYRIQPGDLLTITLAGEADYNQQVRVDWNGRINVPAFAASGRAEVQAAGLSSSALSERLGEFAKEGKVLTKARPQVLVSEYASQTFVVLGQVNQPGRYYFPRGIVPRLPIEEAIALGGGCTRLARQSRVFVKRGNDVHGVNLEKLSTEPGHPAFVIVPGDIITVQERIF